MNLAHHECSTKISMERLAMKALAVFVCVVAGILQAQSQRPHDLPPAVLSSQYFPAGAFDTSTHSSSDRWYARTLNALEEPPLFALRNNRSLQVYRFLWLPSFDRPISVRLTINSDGSGSIVARSVDCHTGLLTKVPSDTAKLILDTSSDDTASDVDKAHVQDVLGQLQGLAFWEMATEEGQAAPQASVTTPHSTTLRAIEVDGSRWIIEGIRDGEYHVVDRWSPKENPYSQFCKYLLRLGKVEVALY
jgi:hypothetical protein